MKAFLIWASIGLAFLGLVFMVANIAPEQIVYFAFGAILALGISQLVP